MGNCHLIEPLENYPVSSRRRRLITSNVSPLDRSDKNIPYCATAYTNLNLEEIKLPTFIIIQLLQVPT